MDATMIRPETLARLPSGPALRVLGPLPASGGPRGRAPRSIVPRIARLFVLTAVLIALIGEGASALRTHVEPRRSHAVVTVRTFSASASRT